MNSNIRNHKMKINNIPWNVSLPKTELHISLKKLFSNTFFELIPTLENKTNYIVHYRNLQLHTKLGMKITKIHWILEFHQSPWLAACIRFKCLCEGAIGLKLWVSCSACGYSKSTSSIYPFSPSMGKDLTSTRAISNQHISPVGKGWESAHPQRLLASTYMR
jgi:hypothetical protein